MRRESEHEQLKKFNGWVAEAQWAAREWRSESWRDCEMYDGGEAQWTQKDRDKAVESGIDIITINRTFPAVNLILGNQAINQMDIIAKGRTQDDGEIGQVMTEGIKFVMDQNQGQFRVGQAFRDSIVPGFGCLSPAINPDPRHERIAVLYRDWKELWWDPFSSPWFDVTKTRYVYRMPWMDLDALQAVFPTKKQELAESYDELAGSSKTEHGSILMDEAQLIEEQTRTLAGSEYVDTNRKRVRPVEMWYPVYQKALYALFADGRCVELEPDMDPLEQYEAVRSSQQVMPAVVKKMRTCTFLSDLVMLQNKPTPYPHDEYPFVPFIGYVDRFGFPYGVPRQIRGQDEEVNKRRSMALALLKSRRVIAEKGVVPDGDKELLQELYEEANKLDGFLVVEDDKIKSIHIDENVDLAPAQVSIMQQSEQEIQEISGANSEASGYDSRAESGKAKEIQVHRSNIMTASVMMNLRRSLNILGTQVVANIQGFWKAEKVLRITDRLTGADRFVALNEQIQGSDGQVHVKNNITQGRYDIVVSEAPATDTVREQNLNLIIEWVKKSPPEIIPHLMQMAFELSNLPNKDQLVAKIKPLLGGDPEEDNLSPEEVKEKVRQQLEAQKQQQAEMAEVERLDIELTLNEKKLKNEKIKAEIAKLLADANKTEVETGIDIDKAQTEKEQAAIGAYKDGIEIGERLMQPQGQQEVRGGPTV